jgi:cytochrome c-type biogenesis protein CcmH
MTESLQTLREQLLQLKARRDSGSLDAKTYAKLRAALERRIIEAVTLAPDAVGPTPSPAAVNAAKQPGRWLWVGAAALALVVAAVGYQWTGTPGAIGQAPADFATSGQPVSGAASAPHAMDESQMAGLTDRLAARLKAQPDDGEGWSMLDRTYMALGRQAEAFAAYEQAVKLRPNDASTIADYADALAVKNGRELAGEPTKLIDRALKLEPDNLKALALAGTAAFNRKDYAQAVKHWDRAVKVGPPENSMVQQAASGAAEARQLGNLPPGADANANANAFNPFNAQGSAQGAAQSSTSTAGVSGTVTLAPALAAKASPDDTVFIFARPAEGSRMPLAIVRKQVKDLPAAYRLDDSIAMSPASLLSTAGRVVVGARISKSGQAMPQPGDLEGLSAPVTVGASGVDIAISGTVK